MSGIGPGGHGPCNFGMCPRFRGGVGGDYLKVSYYPAKKAVRGRLIEDLLTEYRVKHELVGPEDRRRKSIALAGDVPAVEVDGRIFVNPNGEALKKILHLN
jgi:hypothetical protein